MKKTVLGFAVAAILSGCGGSGTEKNEVDNSIQPPVASLPLSPEFYGNWMIDSDTHISVSGSALTLVSYDPQNSCYQSSMLKVLNSTASSLTGLDIATGEVSTLNFSKSGENLLADEDGQVIEFRPENFITYRSPGCPSLHGISSIDVDVELEWLPPYYTLNRDALMDGYIELEYEIIFDVNQNGLEDNGDTIVSLRHIHGWAFSANEQVNLQQISPKYWLFLARNSGKFATTSSDDWPSPTLSVNGNHVRFQVNTNALAEFQHVSRDTPVKVRAQINYPSPESEVQSDWQDGPWAWSNDIHEDTFPDEGFVVPSEYSEMLDAGSDWKRGESQWVDIKQVAVTTH